MERLLECFVRKRFRNAFWFRLFSKKKRFHLSGSIWRDDGFYEKLVEISNTFEGLLAGFGAFATIIGSGFLGWAALRAHVLPHWIALAQLIMGFVTVPIIFVTPLPIGPGWATDMLGFLLIAIVYVVVDATLVAARKPVDEEAGKASFRTIVQAK